MQDSYLSLAGYPRDPEYDAKLGEVRARAHEADVVVGVLDDEIVACLTFVPAHDNAHAEFDDLDATSFRYFGVDPRIHGRGVGSAMVDWCIAETRRLGRRRIRIHTLTMMDAAQRLYERFGFVRDPEHDRDWDGIVGLAYRFDVS